MPKEHRKRVAFLTDEFVIEKPDAGGLGSYLSRITQALLHAGHEPEVFVLRTRSETPAVCVYEGVRVQHVDPVVDYGQRLLRWFDRRFLRSPWNGPSSYLRTALALSVALEKRHRERPFDLVQSANTSASGLFVKKRADRPHVVRLSSHRAAWFAVDGRDSPGAKLMVWLERESIRRGDFAYAPSRFVADLCGATGWREDVAVVRPPMFLETEPAADVSAEVPGRYLVHFGQIGARKGSDVIASALVRVWREEPEFRMIWAGRVIRAGEFESCHRLWGADAAKVVWLGAIEKPLLYAIVQNAVAAVLPSRVDNLPNTVIESLLLGVPVIGSHGASIDELVEPGVCGDLAPIGDSEALARLMLKAWRGQVSWVGSGFRQPRILEDFEASATAQQLLQFVDQSSSRVKRKR